MLLPSTRRYRRSMGARAYHQRLRDMSYAHKRRAAGIHRAFNLTGKIRVR
jgi:hypothetical protein